MSSFASLLQGEINSKKRKAETEAPAQRPGKYVRKGDLMKQKEEQKRQERLEKQKQEMEKRREEEEKERREKEEKAKKEVETTLSWEEEKLLQIPVDEVKKALRALKVPATFFGETNLERAKRLHALEKLKETDIDKGQRHDFGKILASLEEGENLGDDVANKKNKEDDVVWADMVPSCSEEICYFWIRQMLQEWERELDSRSEDEKRQKQGKLRTAEYHQTYQYIRPLLRKLKKKTLADDILIHITRIVKMCKEREYVKANDAYYEMAIGNAAWPIGVTMVGIHERSAREKISSNKTAHVLNDEVARKYIQSLKRLMTFCQEKYVADPSKCVR